MLSLSLTLAPVLRGSTSWSITLGCSGVSPCSFALHHTPTVSIPDRSNSNGVRYPFSVVTLYSSAFPSSPKAVGLTCSRSLPCSFWLRRKLDNHSLRTRRSLLTGASKAIPKCSPSIGVSIAAAGVDRRGGEHCCVLVAKPGRKNKKQSPGGRQTGEPVYETPGPV